MLIHMGRLIIIHDDQGALCAHCSHTLEGNCENRQRVWLSFIVGGIMALVSGLKFEDSWFLNQTLGSVSS
jgi:hypothetical protein